MNASFTFVLIFTLLALVLLGATVVVNNLNAKDIVFSYTALCAAFLMFFLNTALSLKSVVKEDVIQIELSLHNMIADIHSLSNKKSLFYVFNRKEISEEVNLKKYFKIGTLNDRNMEEENFFSFSIQSRDELNSAINDISKFIHIGIIGEMLTKNPDWEIFKNKKNFRGSASYSFNTSNEHSGKNTFIKTEDLDEILGLNSFSYKSPYVFTEGLTLPPDTKVKVKDNTLFIENPFVEIKFGIEINHNTSHFPPESTMNVLDGNFSNTSYMSVNLIISTLFKKERSGSRKMENYKKWVEYLLNDFKDAFEFKLSKEVDEKADRYVARG